VKGGAVDRTGDLRGAVGDELPVDLGLDWVSNATSVTGVRRVVVGDRMVGDRMERPPFPGGGCG